MTEQCHGGKGSESTEKAQPTERSKRIRTHKKLFDLTVKRALMTFEEKNISQVMERENRFQEGEERIGGKVKESVMILGMCQ